MQVAQITAVREAEFARGTGALQDALRTAERLAIEHGVVVLECKGADPLAGLDNTGRRAWLATLQEEGFQVFYTTRLPDGRRELVLPRTRPETAHAVVGTIERCDCRKNLRSTPSLAPERASYVRDVDDRLLLEQLERRSSSR